ASFSPSSHHAAAGVGTPASAAPIESRKRSRDEALQHLGRTSSRNSNNGGGATASAAAAAAAAGVNAGVVSKGVGQGSGGTGIGGGGQAVSNQAWETLRHSLDFWEWILSRLNGFPRPPIITVNTLDQYLGSLPLHCWAEVMARAGLANRTYEDVLSHAEFMATVEAILGHRNDAFEFQRDKAGRNAGPDNTLGISLSLVSSTETPFLMVTDLPADVTHAQMAMAFRPDADVPDRIMFEDINIPVREGIFSGSKGRNIMPQTAALLSFRSEDSARIMQEAWNGRPLRPQHPRRLLVRFSLGLNRGSVWIGGFGARYLDARILIDYAKANWSGDTVMRPVFAEQAYCVQSVRVTFSSCQAARDAIERIRRAPAGAGGAGPVHRRRDAGFGFIGGVSCTVLFSPLLSPLAGRCYRVGDLDGRGAAARASVAATPPPPPAPSGPGSQVVAVGENGRRAVVSGGSVGGRKDASAPGNGGGRQQGRSRSMLAGQRRSEGGDKIEQQQQQQGRRRRGTAVVGGAAAAATATGGGKE
ncbi:unnamed protein product, partial [Scytosiphon promiscuus]